jgi:hypothetical protein
MAAGTLRPEHEPCRETGVCCEEHEWLLSLYRSPLNENPKFRVADLLGACISLVSFSLERQTCLLQYLCTEYVRRQVRQATRRCDIWPAEFDLLVVLHRARWNVAPNPRWDFDQLATGCVAVSAREERPFDVVLLEAREILARRGTALRLQRVN